MLKVIVIERVDIITRWSILKFLIIIEELNKLTKFQEHLVW